MVQWMVQSRLRRRRVVSRQLRHQRRLLAVSEPSPGARKRKMGTCSPVGWNSSPVPPSEWRADYSKSRLSASAE
jgi:hypothetical protein